MKSRICFLYLQNTQNDRESSKRKRHKSVDSEPDVSDARPKTKKRPKSPNLAPKEDGEISDDNDDDSEEDLYTARKTISADTRKQIVYEISDDEDYSTSNSSGRNSPQVLSGERFISTNRKINTRIFYVILNSY